MPWAGAASSFATRPSRGRLQAPTHAAVPFLFTCFFSLVLSRPLNSLERLPLGLFTFATRHFGYENSGFFFFFFLLLLIPLVGGGLVVVLVHRRAWRRDIPFLCAREITDFMFFKWRRGSVLVGFHPCLEPSHWGGYFMVLDDMAWYEGSDIDYQRHRDDKDATYTAIAFYFGILILDLDQGHDPLWKEG